MGIKINLLRTLTRPLSPQGTPWWHFFKNTFRLDPVTINAFIHHHQNFEGKLIFSPDRQILLLHPGEDKHHARIAAALPKRAEGENTIGCYLEFERTSERLLFKINGSSGFYGAPTTEELKKIADYLQAILPKRFKPTEFQSGESEVKFISRFKRTNY